MLPNIAFPEVFLEQRLDVGKFVPLPEFQCGEMSPRASSGPSSGSMASSSSEVEDINDLLSFPLHHGSKSTVAAQQQYDQSQLPLVNLDEDVEDTLGFLYPQSPLDFGDVSVPLFGGLHSLQTCGGALAPTSTMLDDQQQEQQANPLMLPCSKKTEKPRRPVGRPRSQAPPPSTAPTTTAAADGAAAAGQQQQKRGRGPKPKYIFATNDEALDARKERNRKAALESYYRKRQKTDALNQEINRLKAENAKLEKLAGDLDLGVVMLEEATEEGLDAWLAQNA